MGGLHSLPTRTHASSDAPPSEAGGDTHTTMLLALAWSAAVTSACDELMDAINKMREAKAPGELSARMPPNICETEASIDYLLQYVKNVVVPSEETSAMQSSTVATSLCFAVKEPQSVTEIVLQCQRDRFEMEF